MRVPGPIGSFESTFLGTRQWGQIRAWASIIPPQLEHVAGDIPGDVTSDRRRSLL
jgi:hypothetical protein